MPVPKLRHLTLPAVLAIALLAAFAAAACGGDSGSSETTNVIAAVSLIDNAGFHVLDEELTAKGTVPATAETTAKHIQAVALATDWPNDLRKPARDMAKAMGDFAAAIATDTPDIKHATELSNAAHTAWHDFDHEAWSWIQAKAGVGGHEAGDMHD